MSAGSPYPGVSVGGTPLALPNSPLPLSGNALPFLVASPQHQGQGLLLSLALFFPLLVLISTAAGCQQLYSATYSGAQDPSPSCSVFSRLRTAVRTPCLWSVEVPGSQSLNCTIDCWGPGSMPHAHHFELYFYHSARCKTPIAGRVGSGAKLPLT